MLGVIRVGGFISLDKNFGFYSISFRKLRERFELENDVIRFVFYKDFLSFS